MARSAWMERKLVVNFSDATGSIPELRVIASLLIQQHRQRTSVLHGLAGELPDPDFGKHQALLAQLCCLVELSRHPPFPLYARSQIALFLHGMEHRVQGAGAEAVTVVRQLVDHPLPVDFVFRSMMQNMQSNEAGEE